jgi:ABC-type sugar transport system ATPase subunit
VLVISHNLNDVVQVADRVAVLYLGRLASVAPISELDTGTIVELMTTGRSGRPGAAGGEPAHAASRPGAAPSSPAGGTPGNGTMGSHTGEAP